MSKKLCRSAKLDRMKTAATKAAAHDHHIFIVPSYDYEPVPTPNTKQDEASKLEKKVSELTKQVEKLNQKSWNPTHEPHTLPPTQCQNRNKMNPPSLKIR